VSLQEFELEVREDPAHYIYFDLNATGKMLTNFAVVMCGWSIRNISSTTLATLDVYDGTDATGNPLFPINLSANETSREWFLPGGVLMLDGVYVNVTAQEVKGSIFYRRHWGR